MSEEKKVQLVDMNEISNRLNDKLGNEQCHRLQLKDLQWIGSDRQGESFRYNKKEYLAGKDTLESICGSMEVPTPFFMRCNGQTKRAVVEQFLGIEKPIQLVTSNGHVKAILNEKATYVSPRLIFDAATQVLPKSQSQDLKFNDGRFFFELITHEQASPPKRVGDMTRAGVTFSVGRTGYTDWSVELNAFLFRLVCVNGMISPETERFIVRGTSEVEVVKQFQNMLQKVYADSVNNMLPRFMHTAEVQVPDPANAIHQMSRQFNLPSRLRNRIMNHIPTAGQNPALYDVINLVTQTAHEVADLRASRRIQEFGGFVNSTHDHRCPNCHTTIS